MSIELSTTYKQRSAFGIPIPKSFASNPKTQSQIPNLSKSIPIPNPYFFKINPDPVGVFFSVFFCRKIGRKLNGNFV